MTAKKPTTPQITQRKITDYIPDNANANAGSERGSQMLENSLHEVGAGRSLVADATGHIVAGNKTLQAAVDAGITDVIEVETDGNAIIVHKRTDWNLDDKTGAARKYAYLDNRVGQISLNWDADQIAADVAAGVNLDAMFTPAELEDIYAGLDTGEPAIDPGAQIDKAAELQERWQVKKGDLWIIPSKGGRGEHRLLCGDSTNADDVARVIGGDYCKLVVTDPPYGVEYADKNKFLNAVAKGNRIQTPIEGDGLNAVDTQDLWKSAFKNMSDVMCPGAVVYCFMPQGGDQMMMMMMMMGAGIEPRHELIWLKNNHVLGRVDYAYKHEPILYAWKAGGHKFYGDFQTSIIECNKPLKSDMHPTMKPVEIIEKLIKNSSLSNEIIYDMFLGSGTTFVACEQTGRQGRGLEIAEPYCAVILERMVGLGLEPRLESVD